MVYEMYGALFCRVPIRVIKMSIFSLYINWLKQKILDCSSAPETSVCVKHSVKHCYQQNPQQWYVLKMERR